MPAGSCFSSRQAGRVRHEMGRGGADHACRVRPFLWGPGLDGSAPRRKSGTA